MINVEQLREYVIRPALKAMSLHDKNAEELILATAAHESLMGYYLKQVDGPALGLYQMEPKTHYDIYENFLSYRPPLHRKVLTVGLDAKILDRAFIPDASNLIHNIRYATVMCRIHYYRVPEPLPSSASINDMWVYYKKYYNTSEGSATKESFVSSYEQFICGQ